MSKQIFLVGGGGHGRVVLDTLLSGGVKISGLLDPNLKLGDKVFGIPIVGGDEFLNQVSPSDVLLVNGLGANPSVQGRKKLFDDLKTRGFVFHTFQHTSSTIGRECNLGEGSQVMAGAVLQNRVRIGNNTVINTRASIDHDCFVDSHSFISPGVILCGDILIGEATFIGAGAVVLPRVKIGINVIIGAGAVVTKDIADGMIFSRNSIVKIGTNK